jgi:hypothetical protein
MAAAYAGSPSRMPGQDAVKFLGIYLNDHLAGSVVAVNRARHAAGRHAGTELGEFLSRLAEEIEEDRAELVDVMRSLGVRPDPLKTGAARLGELAGRLKFNGALVRTSPLTPFVELELLFLGITGKLAMWRVLRATPGTPAGDAARYDRLIERAERQRAEVDERRVATGASVFAGA